MTIEWPFSYNSSVSWKISKSSKMLSNSINKVFNLPMYKIVLFLAAGNFPFASQNDYFQGAC